MARIEEKGSFYAGFPWRRSIFWKIPGRNWKRKGAGFGTDTNVVTILTKDDAVELPLLSKEEVADRLLDCILEKQKESDDAV